MIPSKPIWSELSSFLIGTHLFRHLYYLIGRLLRRRNGGGSSTWGSDGMAVTSRPKIPSVSGCGWNEENRGTLNHTPQGTEEPLGRRAGRGQQLGGEAWRVASAAGVGCSRKFSLRAWGASITPPRGHAPFALRGRAGRRVPRTARDLEVGRRGTAGSGGVRGSAGPELGHLFTGTVRPLGS